MHAKHQLRQFKRILSHYQRELDVVAAELASMNQNVVWARQELEQAETRLQTNQQRLTSSKASVMNREVGAQLLTDLKRECNEKNQQLSDAKATFETQRNRVEGQLAKIDSLEKLVQSKSEIVAYQQQRTEQLAADEQYLQSSFPKGK